MIGDPPKGCMIESYTVFAICFSFFWGFNTLAHCIFVMKYWVLSFKMQQITKGTSIKHLEIKANLLFYSQVFLIIVSQIFFTCKVIHGIQFKNGRRWYTFFPDFPVMVYCSVLLSAFLRMKRCEGSKYSLSNKQMIIQFGSSLACFFMDFIPGLVKNIIT